MNKKESDDVPRVGLRKRAMHRIHVYAHNAEHPFHLLYFGGLSTGMLDYHLIAGGCLLVGILVMLPAGE